VLFSVTVHAELGDLPAVRAMIEAPGPRDAVMAAESAYRRLHPSAQALTTRVQRIRRTGG
jgi:hypothetical protein